MEKGVECGTAVRVEQLGSEVEAGKCVSSLRWCDLNNRVTSCGESGDSGREGALNCWAWGNDTWSG